MTNFTKRRRQLDQPKRASTRSRTVHGIPFMVVVLVAAVIGCGFLYVRQVNGTTTDGLMVEKLERQAQALKQETTELELRVGKLRSLTTVEEASGELGLVVQAKPTFLANVGESVALGN